MGFSRNVANNRHNCGITAFLGWTSFLVCESRGEELPRCPVVLYHRSVNNGSTTATSVPKEKRWLRNDVVPARRSSASTTSKRTRQQAFARVENLGVVEK
jgi:hypothetical protein